MGTIEREEGNGADATAAARPRGRVVSLDGLRGLGMLAVFVAHLSEYSGLSRSPIDNATLKVLIQGGYFVVMFFVLSGFLITGILIDAKGRPSSFRRFLGRRTRRIFPLYFAFLLVVMVIVPAVFPVSADYRMQVGQQAWYWTYTVNFVVAARGWAPYQFFGHLWTLSVEEQFYLVWPVVVLALGTDRLRRLCILLLGVGLAFRIATMYAHNEVATDVLLLSNVDSLAMGALLAIRARSGNPFPVDLARRVLVGAPVALVSLFVIPLVLPGVSNITWSLAPTVTMVGTAGLIVCCLELPATSPFQRVMTWRPSIALGDISYGIYVIHQPIIFLVVRGWGLDAQDLPAIGSWHLPGMLVVGAVSFAITVALAKLSSVLIEGPAARFRMPRPAIGGVPPT